MKCGNCGSGHFFIDVAKNFIIGVKCADCAFVFQSVRDLYDNGLKGEADYPPLCRWELWTAEKESKP